VRAPTLKKTAPFGSKALYPTFERIGSDPRIYKVGFIDDQGTRVVAPRFDNARPFQCGLASIKAHDAWGAIDNCGNMTIDPISEIPFRISSDRVVYQVGRRRGIMDFAGRVIVEPKYRAIGEFQEGLAWMASKNHYGFISLDGAELLAPFYDDARSFSEGLAPVKLGAKWGFVDKSFDFKIPLQFDFALPFSEGAARVKSGNLWGFIDVRGEYLIRPRYVDAREFGQGLAEVKIDGKWGYIDHGDNLVVVANYRYAGQFKDGLAAVEPYDDPHHHVGFIDRMGRYAIDPQYEMVGKFRNGRCLVKLTEEIAYIDKTGNSVWKGPYVDVGRISEL
jgi:WG containing repeat